MEKRKDGQIVAIAALAIAIVFMSVGFAVFAQNLNINGTATVEKAIWDIHFDDSTFATTSESVAVTPTFDSASTTLSWTATLKKPGDYAEFTVDAKNYGTFDAKLKSITLSSLTAEQAKYLKYYVSYGGGTYSATVTGLSKALAANGSETVKVKLEYFQPTDSADLPSTDVTVNLTAALGYEQA